MGGDDVRRASFILVLISSVTAAVLPAPCGAAEPETSGRAPDVAESEHLAALAFEAYGRKDHQSALLLYQQALEAAPSADIVYNIARIYDNGLRDRALSIVYYERYVEDPGAVASRIETAHRRLTELRAAERAAALPAPVTPSVRAPSAPSSVPARVVTPPAAAPRVARSGSTPALIAGALVAGSAGLAGIGLGVGFGVSAKRKLAESERYCDGDQCTSQRGVEAARAATRAADIATVGFGVGGGLLALGTILWFLEDGEPEEPELGGLDWSAEVGSGQIGLTLAGSFGG
jgi:tetratricopeptide (TPR) repeat protein